MKSRRRRSSTRPQKVESDRLSANTPPSIRQKNASKIPPHSMPWKFYSHRSSPRTSQSFHCQTSRSLFPGKLQTASRTPPPYIRSNLHSRRDFPPTGVLRSCTNTRHTSLRRIQSTRTSPEISVRTLFSCTFPDRRRKDDGASAWKLGFRRIDTRSPCLGTSRRRFDCRAPSSIALIKTTRKAQKIQR